MPPRDTPRPAVWSDVVDLFDRGIGHERELREQQVEGTARALRLEATEIARRLGELNHAHQQAQEVQRIMATREQVETAIRSVRDQIGALDSTMRALVDGLNIRINALERVRASQEGSTSLRQGDIRNLAVLFTVVNAIIALVIAYWRHTP